MAESTTSKSIIKREFERKREQLIREKELDISLEKRHQGLDSFSKGDMKPFVKATKKKLVSQRKQGLIK